MKGYHAAALISDINLIMIYNAIFSYSLRFMTAMFHIILPNNVHTLTKITKFCSNTT